MVHKTGLILLLFLVEQCPVDRKCLHNGQRPCDSLATRASERVNVCACVYEEHGVVFQPAFCSTLFKIARRTVAYLAHAKVDQLGKGGARACFRE